QYVIENKNPNNLTTYDYLTELKDDNYSDAKSIYDDLYEWKAELVCFNTDKNDYTTILNSIKKNESYLHFSFEITGGMPGTKTTFTHSIKLPGSNTDKSSWDWEGRELGDNLSAQWSSGFSSNRGEAIIKIIHKDSGKVIGEFSFKITT
ncbi:MAG: hypothetical protein J5879_02720, partial [Clostridia bacterium]|nr:hypothetical protein [Clostridia bacterium]